MMTHSIWLQVAFLAYQLHVRQSVLLITPLHPPPHHPKTTEEQSNNTKTNTLPINIGLKI